METYIIFTGITNIIAGESIYVRNKVCYLEEREWNVIVFPIDDGEAYIHGLNRCKRQSQAFIRIMPGKYI